MSKNDLQKLCTLRDSVCTAPPREWLAIPEDGSQTVKFNLNDVENCDDGQYIEASDEDGNYVVYLHLCHLCAATGYTDSKGEKVYGGSVVQCYSGEDAKTTYWTAHWDGESWGMRLLPTGDSFDMMMSEFFDGSCKTEIIAHIHTSKLSADGIPSEWSKILSDSEVPEEVSEILSREVAKLLGVSSTKAIFTNVGGVEVIEKGGDDDS